MELPYPIINLETYYHPMQNTIEVHFLLEHNQKFHYMVAAEMLENQDSFAIALKHLHSSILAIWEDTHAPDPPNMSAYQPLSTHEHLIPEDYFATQKYYIFKMNMANARKFDWKEFLVADFKEPISCTPPVNSSLGTTVRPTMKQLLPGLEQRVGCPYCSTYDILMNIVIHINDTHKKTREEIADWLDTLDIDLRFKETNG